LISLIVPVKNGLEHTRALVSSVTAGNPKAAVEWVIVDSGSTDGTPAFCAEIEARVVPFRSEPFNYCAALNAGAAAARGSVWIFSNNDVEFRSAGDLARIERVFRDWPVLGVLSPGRPSGEAELEFSFEWLYGPCWAIRPEAFRAWGGLPEGLTGYGYDEVWTVFQCWRHAYALAWLTGWKLHHHGSATFGPLGATVTPAMRRNLSRLLTALDAEDLDGLKDADRIIGVLREREMERAPQRLAVGGLSPGELLRQGYANTGSRDPESRAAATVIRPAGEPGRQWLPWLANELLLQPEAAAVGADGWYAVRDAGDPRTAVRSARSVGPPAPPLMPFLNQDRRTLRRRISAWLHDLRHRRKRLPKEW
jgi:hypothetical protein